MTSSPASPPAEDSARSAPPSVDQPTAERIIDVVRGVVIELRQAHATTPTLDSSLDRDLGLDSLARVELALRLERTFGVALPDHAVADAETPRDLLRAVEAAAGAAAEESRTPAAATPAPPPAVAGSAEPQGFVLPDRAETLIEVLDWHIRRHGERTHIRLIETGDGDEVIGFAELRRRAERIAAGLQRADIHPGEAVAIMLPTGADYFAVFLGIMLVGGVPVPLYPPGRIAQIEDHLRRHAAIVENSQARLLVTIPEATRFARLLMSTVESLRGVATSASLAAGDDRFAPVPVKGGDIAFLQYTSGSTGAPKGVILTHANLLANIRAMGRALRVGPDDVVVSWLPLYHDMGLIGAWFGSLYHALPLVIMSPLAFLARPKRWLHAIHRHRGTISAAPNFAYDLCLKRIEDSDLEGIDLSSWRVAANGAEAVIPETMLGFCDRFAPFGFRRTAMMPMYGLAECCVGLAMPARARDPIIDAIDRRAFRGGGSAKPAAADDPAPLRFVACGVAIPGHEIRIADELGRELPERREGRVQFRGPSATSGYFRNPEATRRLFVDDWRETGDLGYLADGELYITGRVKDLIIRAGRNIYPPEIEQAVGEILGVREGGVAVFGVADARAGTEKLVVLAETRLRDDDARADLKRQIADAVVRLVELPPDDVVLAPPNAVLKTSSGKIRRNACREMYLAGTIGRERRAVWWQLLRFSLGGVVPSLRRGGRAVLEFLFAAWAWLALVAVVLVTWPTVVLTPGERRKWAATRAGVRTLRRLIGVPFAVEGIDRLPPADQPAILVANHASYLDAIALLIALPRRYGFVAKAELKHHWFTRLFLRAIGAEFVERFEAGAGIADAKRLAATARGGKSLLFFPEGTFVRRPGLLPFQMGAFMVAAEANLPVVPIAIRGTRSMLRADSTMFRRGRVSVVVGAAILPATTATADPDPWRRALALRAAARATILAHCREPDLGEEVSPLRQVTAARG